MNKLIWVFLSAASALAAAGCGGMRINGTGPCMPNSSPSTHSVTLNARATERRTRLQIAPPQVRVCAGDTVEINVVPPVQAGEARTRAKPGNNARWLDVETDDGERIVIRVVPADGDQAEVVPSGPYDYIAEVDSIGLLDPRIIVR